ncbi:hypothetical protein BVSY1_24110 [Bacillus velezensis]|nr:hypothetical protein KOF112_27940 [Bacillus velezensis]GJI63255.1 hypothetical protein BVSY1_24110 [Bacillus velezensis]
MTFTYRLIISPFDEPPALTYAIPVVSKKMINIKAETESCSLLIFKIRIIQLRHTKKKITGIK